MLILTPAQEPSMQEQLIALIVRHGLPKVLKSIADITKDKGVSGLSRPGIERSWAAMLTIRDNIYHKHLKSLK